MPASEARDQRGTAERPSRSRLRRYAAQALVVALGLVPAAVLVADALGGRLSVNPIEDITHRTGEWTLYLLLTTLAVTPLRRLTGWGQLVRFRRTVGLLAFGYACLHFLTYIVLDQGLLLQSGVLKYVGEDVMKRPYITVGFTAFVLLLPLALTSTKGWVRRLGGRRWNALHRLVYLAGAAAVLHYLWLVKGEQLRPVWFALVLVGLLAARLVAARRRQSAAVGTVVSSRGTPSTSTRSRAAAPLTTR
jgi:sulfoxide reductase heme-binding subunit YedZ